MPGDWTPEHRAAYEEAIARRRAARARGETPAPRHNAPLTDEERHSAAAAMDRALGGVPPPRERPEGAEVSMRCACTHYHWRGRLEAGKRPDLGCTEGGCGCKRWHRKAAKAPKVAHPAQIRPQSPVPPAAVHRDDRILLDAVEALRGEVRALLARPISDPIVHDRIERIRQMVLSIDGKVARPSAVKAVIDLSPIEGRLLNIERACVRLINEQAAVRVELARVASRPAVIREFRQNHRRIADGGQPASRQRRTAGAGRAPRPIEPTARAG